MSKRGIKAASLPDRWELFWLLAGLVLMTAGAILFIGTVEAIHLLVRVTAYASLVPFLAVFVASAAATLAPNAFTRWLLHERRYLGLAFAFSQLVQLAAILGYGALEPRLWSDSNAAIVAAGTVGYAFTALMAATSFHVVSGHIGTAAWKRLHTTGVWVIATLYAVWFLYRIATASILYVIPFFILCVAIALRVAGKRAQTRKRAEGPKLAA